MYPDQAEGEYRHVTNHDPGYKRIAIHLDGFDGFELDGAGSTLMCHGVMMPVGVDKSKDVTLRNLVIDWDKPFHLEGAVVGVGEDYFDVQMLPECQAEVRNGKLLGGVAEGFWGDERTPRDARQDIRWNYWIDPSTKAAATAQPTLKLWNPNKSVFAETTELGANLFRLRHAHVDVLPAVGSVMICKGMFRPNRLSPAIHLASVDHSKLENITIHHAGGMGLVAEDCADVTVQSFQVTLKPGSESLLTVTADATHFVNCRGTLRVEHCLFENMLDDSCNVHGVYAIAEELVASNRLAIRLNHFQQAGVVFARPGDRLRLLKRDTLLGYAECNVTGITEYNDNHYVLALDLDLSRLFQTNSSVENLSARPEVIFRNNVVRNNNARSLLVSSGRKTLVESNLFEHPRDMNILIEGDNHFWYESGGVEDVIIRNNKFLHLSSKLPVFKIAPNQPGERRALPPYHRQIRILDNFIAASSPVIIEAKRVAGLEFSGNTVQLPPASGDVVNFQLQACEDSVFRNNTINEPARIRCNPPMNAALLENNKNLSLQ